MLSEFLRHLSIADLIIAILVAGCFVGKTAMVLFAGLTVIFARDERPKAQRALEVLRALCRDRQPPPGPGESP